MTIEIERQFFNTFDIKPTKELIFRTMNCACGCHDCKNCDKYKNNLQKTYPQITDNILLKLICILHKYSNKSCLLVQPYGENIEQLKKETLISLIIFYKNTSRHQKNICREVQTLFEER